ncbi:MAG: flagellar hook-length control protein FliK [Butyrivibrio sp.]|nr:flagellar hook-length control protein FliK [Muribaculum sp.]MCM1552017.1 flagellar hook-length control protein FliK [Butyrivibrio sp.]
MTTTSVKGAGSVMNLGVQVTNASTKGASGSFQTVWNSQTNGSKNGAQQDGAVKKSAENAKKVDDTAKPGSDLRTKDRAVKELNEEDVQAVDETDGELTEEELEEAMEVVMTAVTDLIQQIADTFGVSVEDVQAIMSDMELQPMDLLQPENLSNLLLEVSGAQDTMSLLTNEQMYNDYQMLMEQGKAVLEESSQVLELTPEQLMQTVTKLQTADGGEKKEPIIELTRVDEEANVDPEQAQKAQNPLETVQKEANAQDNAGETKQETGKGESDRHSTDGEGNLVLQTMKDEAFQIHAEDVQAASSTGEVDTQDIMKQIMDYMRIQVKSDVSSLEMQLHPENLGTLQIHVAAKGGVLTANFVAQNEAVKAALESQMVQLKESFEEQGVKVEAIEVTVQTHQFEQNLEQGRGNQSGESTEGKRPRTRRINLNGLEEAELPEDMEQEDRLTAEMMAANGTTVDYTA